MKRESEDTFLERVVSHVISKNNFEEDYLKAIYVTVGASEHVIFYLPSKDIILTRVKTNIEIKPQEEKRGIRTGLIIPSLTCGEYKIGYSTLFSNIRIVTNIRKSFVFLDSIDRMHPVQFFTLDYDTVVLEEIMS
jgi:hypothetical protein